MSNLITVAMKENKNRDEEVKKSELTWKTKRQKKSTIITNADDAHGFKIRGRGVSQIFPKFLEGVPAFGTKFQWGGILEILRFNAFNLTRLWGVLCNPPPPPSVWINVNNLSRLRGKRENVDWMEILSKKIKEKL